MNPWPPLPAVPPPPPLHCAGGMQLGRGGERTEAITLDSLGLKGVSFIKVCGAPGLAKIGLRGGGEC